MFRVTVSPNAFLVFRLRSAIIGVLTLGIFAAGAIPAAADELVLFAQDGCPYCAAWDREVGRIYPKTDEAKLLPLRRIDIHAPRTGELAAVEGLRFTPTFIVMHCGRELRRITGYTGDDQFWGLLGMAVKSMRESTPCPK